MKIRYCKSQLFSRWERLGVECDMGPNADVDDSCVNGIRFDCSCGHSE